MLQSLVPVFVLSILVIPLPIAVYLTAILLRRDVRIGTPIAMIVIAGATWSAGYAMELLFDTPEQIRWATAFQYIGLAYGPVGWFLLGVRLRRYVFPLLSWRGLAIFVVPTITYLCVLTSEHHTLNYRSKELVEVWGFLVYQNEYGPLFWLHIAYSYSMNIIGVFLITVSIMESQNFYLSQRIALLVSLILPWIANIMHIFKLDGIPIDYSPLTLFVSGIALYIAVMKFKLGELMPVARSKLIAEMGDALMVFDSEDRMIDLNEAATKLFHPNKLSVGMAAAEVFADHPRLMRYLDEPDSSQASSLVYTGFHDRIYRFTQEALEASASRMVTLRDVSSESRTLDALQVVLAGVGQDTGEAFCRSVSRALAMSLPVRTCLVGSISPDEPDIVKTLAFWDRDDYVDNVNYSLHGAPCENVVNASTCCYPNNVKNLFPEDVALMNKGIEAYVGTPLFSHDGHPIGLLAIMDDKPLGNEELATSLVEIFGQRTAVELERSIYEERIASSEANYRQIVETTKDGVCVADLDGNIRFVNDPMAAMLGVERSQAAGQALGSLLSFDLLDAEELKVAGEETRELWFSNQSGTRFCVSLSKTVIQTPEGKPHELLFVFVDLTEIKMVASINEEIERQMQQTQKVESLGVLAGGVAHDFNNLLTPILGYVDLAKPHLRGQEAEEYLDKIQEAGEKLADLCSQMLTYSGKGQFLKEPLDLNVQLSGFRELARATVPRTTALYFHLDGHLPPVLADGTQINQVVLNLLINASEAMTDSRGAVQITTGTELLVADDPAIRFCDQARSGEYVYVDVEDNGVGISPENLQKMFEPFFTTKFEGRGLGMAVVYGILKAHQGAIRIVSEQGKETSIRVYFPIEEEITISAAEKETTEQVQGSAALNRGKVLVVDDEDYVRGILRGMLEHMGFEAIEAEDGDKGLAAFSAGSGQFTACVVDLTMPGMAGMELLDHIRKLDDKVPVLLVSGYSRHEVCQQEAKSTNVSFLQKPFTMDQFKKAMEAKLG